MKSFRIVTIFVSIMLVFFVWISYSSVLASSDGVFSKTIEYQNIYVKPGDSVWSIAANYCTPKDDIRNVVLDIKKVNGLSNNVQIYPGQSLKVPVRSKNNDVAIRVTKVK